VQIPLIKGIATLIVDTLKRQCPTFAVMRKLVIGFRAILSGGKVPILHRSMEDARKTGIHSLDRFVGTLKQALAQWNRP